MSHVMPALLAQIGLDRQSLLSEVGAVLLPHMDAALDAMFLDTAHLRQVMTGQVTHGQQIAAEPSRTQSGPTAWCAPCAAPATRSAAWST